MLTDDDFLIDDNLHTILAESALHEKPVSLFDFGIEPDPSAINLEEIEDDTLRNVMIDSIDEIEKSESGEIDRFDDDSEKSCQTFAIPTEIKKLFEQICKSNYTTPSCFLRNVCQRLVESYYGKKPVT
jgi:hypothetical protein